jgi:hypothetical protein
MPPTHAACLVARTEPLFISGLASNAALKRKSSCYVLVGWLAPVVGLSFQRQQTEDFGGLGLPLSFREIVTQPKKMKKLFHKLKFLFLQMAI